MKLRTKIALALAVCIAFAAVTARIVWVNTTQPRVTLETYEMYEWVSLDGAFFTLSGEGTDNYSVRVDDIQLMSVDEYLRAYDDGTEELGLYGDARSLVVLTLSLKNEGEDQGGFALGRSFLTPSTADELYYPRSVSAYALEPLTPYDGPETEDSYARGLGIPAGTECQIHVAYLVNHGDESVLETVSETDFTLYLAEHPIRKMVRLHVEEG